MSTHACEYVSITSKALRHMHMPKSSLKPNIFNINMNMGNAGKFSGPLEITHTFVI